MLASADTVLITIAGKQTHGTAPWGGIDPIVIGSQVVMGLQTIVSRNVNITEAPAIVTVGRFTGSNRSNIVPDTVELEGTIRAYSEDVRKNIHDRVRAIATHYAEAAGGTATVEIGRGTTYHVTINDPALTERMLHAHSRGGYGQRTAGATRRSLRRLLVLPAEGPGPVCVPRRDQDTRWCRRITPRSFCDRTLQERPFARRSNPQALRVRRPSQTTGGR